MPDKQVEDQQQNTNQPISNQPGSTPQDYVQPIVAPCRVIPYSAPFTWLKKGWADLRQVPKISLSYGLVMMLISVLITFVAYKAHSIILAIAMTAGFFFIGPIIAIGLYSLSRQISNDVPPLFLRCLREGKKNLGNEMVLSFMFLIVFLIWARAASMLHIFFPSTMKPEDWLMFLGVGTVVGAVFAAIIFCVGAFSIPMLMDRKVDTITAVVTSINAVLKNKLTMLIWGFVIVVLILIGVFTFFIGFIVLLPLVGHATWHAYKDTIDADAWELGPGLGVNMKNKGK
ncbi:putative cytochrome c oxidase, subunit I [hydrothermal vent metagenome]|uniref:Putative cytochrome c oxidase, subunit I n=1 Tax=hydrothermal vent metagenome TaxID=652676 RepID=A0A3B0VWI1_9ZZZZ